MRRRRFQKGSLQLRKHGNRRVWVVLYYDEKSERRYHTLGWATDMNKGTADEKRQDFMREINGGGRTIRSDPPANSTGVPRSGLLAVLPRQMEGIDGRNVGEPPSASHRERSSGSTRLGRSHAGTAPAVPGSESGIRAVIQRRGSPAMGPHLDVRDGSF